MLQIKINNKKEISLEKINENQVSVDEKVHDKDIQKIAEREWSVILNNQSYNIFLKNFNTEEKTAKLKINGKVAEVKINTELDLLLKSMGLESAGKKKIASVKAPMPGLVVEIKIAVGDDVKKGDALLILEAMKMQNVIKSPVDAVVKAVKVEAGMSLEKNETMILFA